MPIRVLDAATVGRISAGEVVERPSSVVKELVENSLDAGATSITVEIRGGGIDYLRVTDNGCGIEAGQVRMAFANHATSKLQNADQLDDIRTMGFRGEALPSIAAVSRVEMTTRTKGAENGVRFSCEGGEKMQVTEAGCPQGTTIVMRDLFFNVPVRRTFLKKASYEGGLVSDAVTRLLLGNPSVSMRFISGGNTLFHSFGDGKLRHAVFAIYGRQTAEAMTEVDAFEGGTRIYGLIGTGELGKQTRAHQMFFINGRSVRSPLLTRALEAVCRSRVTIGLYPMCVLNLVVPSAAVDVNVHPNKLEVRFRDEENMREVAERLLSRAFEGERVLDIAKLAQKPAEVETRTYISEISSPPKEPMRPATVSAEVQREMSKDHTAVSTAGSQNTEKVIIRSDEPKKPSPQMPPIPGLADFGTVQADPGPEPSAALRENIAEEKRPLKTIEPIEPVMMSAKSEDLQTPAIVPNTKEKPVQLSMVEVTNDPKKPEQPDYRVIGVVFKTYILVEAGEMLLLIDQHAAHERLQYEKLWARAQEGKAAQALLTPIVIPVSPVEQAIVADNLELLKEAGYAVEVFGDRDLRISEVPFVMGRAEVRPLFLDMLDSLTKVKNAAVDVRRGEIMQAACKSAVKGGDQLSPNEIDVLVREMQETGAPATCPHGRPVVKVLTKRDLEKMFKRIQ